MLTGGDRFIPAILAIIIASALSSIGWIFEGEAINRLSPLPVVCTSLWLGGLSLLGLGYLSKRASPFSNPAAYSSRFIAFSIIRSAIVSLLFGYCLTLTSSTKTMFLTKIEPYMVLLIQIIWLGHRTTMGHLALLAIHMFGAVMLSTGGSFALSVDTLGDLLIFICVTANAALYFPARRYSQELGPMYASGLSQLYGGAVLLPFMLAYSMSAFNPTPEHMTGWYYALLTVVVFYIVSTGLWFFSMKDVPA